MSHDPVHSIAIPLPEDIRQCVDAGYLQDASLAISERLKQDLPQALRDRLLCEKERLRRMTLDYPFDREGAVRELQKYFPTATAADFDRLDRQGRAAFLFVEGQKRWYIRFAKTLARDSYARKEFGLPVRPANDFLDSFVDEVEKTGKAAREITMEAEICVQPEHFTPGRYRVWLPFPLEEAQQSDVQLLSGAPDALDPPHAWSRSAFWEKELTENTPFTLRYRLTSTILRAHPLKDAPPASPLYPNQAPPTEEDLSEDGVHIVFTPYMRSLAASLTKGLTGSAEKAFAIYRFVTEKVRYSFVRDYFLIDHIGEYCAINLKGDCGLQAICFIILCRICGIPARWQSGLCITGDEVDYHDWAQFYLGGWGWLFADLSMGGSAFRAGAIDRQRFFFGHLDPARVAANSLFMAPLHPEFQHFRQDPYDHQGGEIELVGAGESFTKGQIYHDQRLISLNKIC
ncbi:MAG: transglutaminase domain-containing protein [Clostridia bacterium]|nr:transglutaminase domain-containing protein [Clostridia bacterium]